jgi:hypothetical protein
MTSLTSDRQLLFAPKKALWLVLAVSGVVTLRSVEFVSTWHMTHWSFTYEHGFIKRGLVGEIASRVFGTVTPSIINVLVWSIFLLLAIALTCWFIKPAWDSNRVGAWLFAIVAMTSSATIPHFEYDFGRFDQINLIILLTCLFILGKPSKLLRHIVIPLLCVIGLLIHEAFSLMFVPVIFAVWIYEERFQWIWPKIFVLASLVVIVWAVDTYGIMHDVSEQDYMAELQQRHSFRIHPDSVHVLYRTVKENISFNLEELRKYARANITHHIVFALSLLPTFILFYKLTRRLCVYDGAKENMWRLSLVVAALSPLSLCLLASDFFRFWSIALTNLFIIFTYLAIRLNRENILADVVERSPMFIAWILAVSLVFGPLGIMVESYPFISLGFLPGWTFTW